MTTLAVYLLLYLSLCGILFNAIILWWGYCRLLGVLVEVGSRVKL